MMMMMMMDKEDECLMVALRSLEADGWLVHSLQQDGLLVEAGRRADGCGLARGTVEEAHGARRCHRPGRARDRGGWCTEVEDTGAQVRTAGSYS